MATREQNRLRGLAFEKEFCKELSDAGMWVHNLAQAKEGQPADVIAVYGDHAYLIDCKTVTKSGFRFSRIEPNQQTAMDKWDRICTTCPYFAIKLDDGRVFMLPWYRVRKEMADGKAALCDSQIYMHELPLADWIKWVKER